MFQGKADRQNLGVVRDIFVVNRDKKNTIHADTGRIFDSRIVYLRREILSALRVRSRYRCSSSRLRRRALLTRL